MIWVFLPAYNEERSLETLVKKFHTVLGSDPYKIVVMDDGSTDRTVEIAETLSKAYPLTLLRHEKNQGLGATLRDGFTHVAAQAAPEDLIVTMDCDDTHEPSYTLKAVEKIRQGYDMVILSRYQEGGGEEGLSALKSFLSKGAGFFLKTFFPIRGVKEYSCGYRVCTAASLKKVIVLFKDDFVSLPKWGFVCTAEILIKFHLAGCRIGEVPFVLRYDQKPGPSKNKPLKTIAGYFLLVRRYWGRKPGSVHA